jgi:hypothetical protein
MTSLPQPPSALGQTLSVSSASSEGTTQELVRVGTKCDMDIKLLFYQSELAFN